MKTIKKFILLLMLICVAAIGFACSGTAGKLRIDAPSEIEAELGTYAIPKYDVVNEKGVVMAGYTVTLVSVKDSDGNKVQLRNNRSIVIETAGIYTLEYTANNKKIDNVTVKADFADRTPPTVNVNLDNYPDLFIKGHEYSVPPYNYSGEADRSKCWLKIYYQSETGEKTEKSLEAQSRFKVTESDGKYEFVFHGEDAVGNVKEVTHTVPVDGPENIVEGRIAYFDEAFGARQLKFSNAENLKGIIDAKYINEEIGGRKGGSTEITIAQETNYAFISVAYPVIEDLSNYDSFKWSVYNPNDYKLQFGFSWTAYKTLEPKKWTEFSLPTSYFRHYDSSDGNTLQNMNESSIYEDNIKGLRFVVLHEKWAGNEAQGYNYVPAGTKLIFSSIDAMRDDAKNDLRISGESYNCVYDETEYELGEYNIVNRADVALDTDASVTLVSATAPDGSDAEIVGNVLKFKGEGIYTLVYEGTYDGDKYDSKIEPLTVKIMNGGSMENVTKGEPIDGCAVYADRKWGLTQIFSATNVAAQTDTETKYSSETASMKFTVISDGTGDVVFNTETMANPERYAAIQFSVYTKNDAKFRVFVTYGENSQELGGHRETCFGDGNTEWVTVTAYLGNKDRAKLGIHFFNDYSGTPVPAGTEFFVSNIKFVEAGYKNQPKDSTVNLMTEDRVHSVPKTITGRDNVDYAVSNVNVTFGDKSVEIADGKFTMDAAGKYVVKYVLHDKEYSYTVMATTNVEDIDLLYDPNVKEYTVSSLMSVTDVKLNGVSVERDGNTFTLTDGGEYIVTATVFGEEKTFSVKYAKPTNIIDEVAVYAEEFGIKQIAASNNVAVKVADDAAKGKVLLLTLSADQTGVGATGVKFKSVSAIKNYDYISFDIKASVNDVYVAYSADGLSNWSSHFAIIGTEWKRVSFALSVTTTWYQDNGYLGLSFFKDFGAGVLPAGAVFEITNICLEKGNAQIKDVENYNIAQSGETYTFPTTVSDSHIRYWDGSNKPVDCGVKIVKVVKDGKEIALNADGLGFNAEPGFYTVHYATIHDGEHLFHTEYYYTISVIDVHIANETLYYTGNENYTLPVKSVGGKAVTVTSITYGDGQTVECVGGSFLLTSGTPETANDTYKYVYTVNYTLAGDEATYSYTVTYYKPESIKGRPVYLDTSYGLNHQLTVENASAKHSASAFTQVSDGQKLFGDGSVELTVQEDGVVWLHFENVIWDSSYLSLRIAFSTSSVLRYGIYDAKGNKVGEDHTAFVAESEAERWSFAANGGNDDNGFVSVGNNDMSSFSIKLFSAYDNNGVLAAGTKILVAGLTAHPW